jgi:hypothetical protein
MPSSEQIGPKCRKMGKSEEVEGGVKNKGEIEERNG